MKKFDGPPAKFQRTSSILNQGQPDPLILSGQGMDSAPDDVYFFRAPGVASVRWDPEAELVLVEWEGWANSAEFAQLLDAEVRALQQHQGSRLLADCRRQKVIKPEDQTLADKAWLPRALAAGLKRFAVVLPTSVLAEMNIRDALGRIPGTALHVEYFSTMEEAQAWLLE